MWPARGEAGFHEHGHPGKGDMHVTTRAPEDSQDCLQNLHWQGHHLDFKRHHQKSAQLFGFPGKPGPWGRLKSVFLPSIKLARL